MNKTGKKIIASFLAMSFILTYIPAEIVLANYQSLVNDIDVADRTPNGATASTLDIVWRTPTPSTKPDNNAVSGDADSPHLPTAYRIKWRNGTESEAYGNNVIEEPHEAGKTSYLKTINPTLDKDSIYSFKVDPYHLHTYPDADGRTYQSEAPVVSGEPAEALHMTDITVSTESVAGGFKVTWGNPTYMGANIFNGYRLYYTPRTTSTFPTNAPSINMYLDDEDVIFNKDGTITYTFETSNVSVGELYSLKIEPLYEGNPIRLNGRDSVVVRDKTYPFSYTDYTTHEFRVDDAYVKPALYLKEEGTDKIKLYWNPISSTSGTVSKIEIYEYPADNENDGRVVGIIAQESATSINEWVLPKPDQYTSYKIVITFKSGTKMESNKVFYDPAFTDFEPYKPIIHFVETDESVPNFVMYWQAFLRKPYNADEEAQVLPKYNNLYNDKNLSYKIWVTDDLNNLSNSYFSQYYIEEKDAESYSSTEVTIPNTSDKTLDYYTTINGYYSFENEVAELKPLEGNKIYYIKIQATRKGTLEKSEEEYYSIYIPPNGDIVINPITMGTPPLRIAKDKEGAELITDNSITITWDTMWFEVYDEKNDAWSSVIGVNDKNEIVYGKDALALENPDNILELYTPFDTSIDIATTKSMVEDFLTERGVDLTGNPVTVRKMDISKSKYELFTAQYNYVEDQGGYETYYETITDSELWYDIQGDGTTNPTYKVTSEQAPEEGDLKPNTPYLIYMRTYTLDKDGNKIYAYNPAYVVGNTTDTPTDIIIVPPSQMLEAVTSTETSVTFRFEYTDGFKYTLRYSEKTSDYSDGGIEIDSKTLLENGELKIVDDVTYVYYTIENLFPETTYYAWLSARNGDNISDWSLPASISTLELVKPKPPKGLGPMGLDNVKIINEDAGTNYVPIAEDYIIMEWLRLYEDTELPKTGIISDDTGFGEEILLNKNIVNSYGVKFNSLEANKRYYFRVKSVKTAVKQGDGSAVIYYSYIISKADNPDFIDAEEFEVPPLDFVAEDGKCIIVESEWGGTVSIVSGKSDSEYDGDFDPELFPLPENDYEIIYDSSTGELSYILRGPGLDSNGIPNNGSDQRFISKVINDHIYDYAIDLSQYNGTDVSKARVVIPYSIIKALEDQKVTMTVKTGNMYTKFDLGIFTDAIKQNNLTVNKNTKAEVYIKDINNLGSLLKTGESYVSNPQNIAFRVITDTRTVDIKTVQKPVTVSMAIDNRYLVNDKNVAMYSQLNGVTNSWTPATSKYNYATNKFSYDTKNLGNFSVISKPITNSIINADANQVDNLYSVNTVINVTDMGTYNPNAFISANQFNNIIWAVIKDSPTVSMNKTLDQTAYTELGRGKMLVSGVYVTREKGIASLARLYELKTKEAIVPVNALSAQGFSDYASVSSEYQQGVNKAIEIGMISGSQIRPRANMTFGEFMDMLELVVLDKK